MKFPSFAAAFGALLALSTGCSDAVQPEPPVVETPTAPPIAPPAPGPALAAAYVRVGSTVRYAIYEDSTFALEYPWQNGGSYSGRYLPADTVLTFSFDIDIPTSGYSKWEATGTIRGDTLSVKYNDGMTWLLWVDFLDGGDQVFVRSGATQ